MTPRDKPRFADLRNPAPEPAPTGIKLAAMLLVAVAAMGVAVIGLAAIERAAEVQVWGQE